MTYRTYTQHVKIGDTNLVYTESPLSKPIINNINNGVEISVFPTTIPMLYKINIGYFNTLYFSTRNGRFFSTENNLYEVIMFILGETLNLLIMILGTIENFDNVYRSIEDKNGK